MGRPLLEIAMLTPAPTPTHAGKIDPALPDAERVRLAVRQVAWNGTVEDVAKLAGLTVDDARPMIPKYSIKPGRQ